MAFDFKGTAVSATTISPIMDNRTRITMDELISKYPGGVTVNGFDMVPSDDNPYAVATFAEDSSKFFFGGSILTKIVSEWVKSFDGDVEGASKALAEAGGVKMQFSHGRTKKGNSLTLVKVL